MNVSKIRDLPALIALYWVSVAQLLLNPPSNYARNILFKEYFIKLEANPYSIAVPLQGTLKGTHKVSVGNKRMIILINEIEKTVNVLAIGPRGDIYK